MENDQNKTEIVKFNYFKTIGKIIGIFFIGFSIYLFVSTLMLVLLTKSTKEVRIPDITGKRFVEAYNNLVRIGVRPEIKFKDLFDVDDGVVLKQYPEKGAIVKVNSTMKLVVSRSLIKVDVPNLIGKDLPMALNKMKNLHFHDRSISLSSGMISYINSEKSADNVVIDQSPRAGEKVTPDRKINLLVSMGSLKEDNKMPDVVGQSIDLCYDQMAAKGLVIIEEIVETMNISKSGVILAQNPPKGRIVAKGTVATIKVGWYPNKEHPYSIYEKVSLVIPNNNDTGLYEGYIEDNRSKRIRFSRNMKPGQTISFIFHREGDAKINIVKNKETILVKSIEVD